MTKVKIDCGQLALHLETLLRRAPKGSVVRLCAFPEKDEAGPAEIRTVKFTGDMKPVITAAKELARWAARQASAYVVCVPSATFSSDGGKEVDLAAGLALSVDLDKHPAKSRKRLERVLGPATLCIKSGGYWGHGKKRQPTVHLYWLLSMLATGADLSVLKEVRRLAIQYAGGDPTAVSIVHGLRCAGTLHRKGRARTTSIEAHNPKARIDLRKALERLRRVNGSQATTAHIGSKKRPEVFSTTGTGPSSPIAAILDGKDYHASLTSLAMQHALAGMSKTSIEATLRTYMDGVSGELRDIKEGKTEPGRWSRRVAEIPAIAESAVEKVRNSEAWPEPLPLPSSPPVPALSPQMLPKRLRKWLTESAAQMQVPVDYIAVSAITAAGAAVGRNVGIQPKPSAPWIEVPTSWACIIGHPGIMKSPCLRRGLAPLLALEARAAQANGAADLKHKRDLEMHLMRKKAVEAASKKALKGDPNADLSAFVLDPPPAPAHERYIVHDATYQSLGKILADNPRGVLVYRDELAPFLTHLEDKNCASLRGLILSSWSGHETHASDTLGRGHVGGKPHCISLIGSSQPSRFAAYVRSLQSGKALDDGMLQRFGLLIYPDEPETWKDVSVPIDEKLDKAVHATFKRLAALDGSRVRATRVIDNVPVLQFDKGAQKRFDLWRAKFERRLRSSSLPEPLIGHFSKYRKLVPSLALIFHLIDVGEGPIGLPALKRSLAWAAYLEAHARRAYGGRLQRHVEGARLILEHVAKRKLPSPFTERELARKEWAGLTDAKVIKDALQLLWDHRAVRRVKHGKTYLFEVNPALMPGAAR
jgi:hypothetical protein